MLAPSRPHGSLARKHGWGRIASWEEPLAAIMSLALPVLSNALSLLR